MKKILVLMVACFIMSGCAKTDMTDELTATQSNVAMTDLSSYESHTADDNEYLGCFMCGGKMAPQILEKYRQMQAIHDTPQIRTLIAAYEDGMLHPNEQDFKDAEEFVKSILRE